MVKGAVLQCLEAASLGMPFEVWKTRMGRFRDENTIRAFINVYKNGGGVTAYWSGLSAKMVESASKGAVLMVAKEAILDALTLAGVNNTVAGLIAGAGGGVCQTSVMGPCTFLVTAVVTGGKGKSVAHYTKETWQSKGIKGFYPGGSAVAWRQATNWASRQAITEYVRDQFKLRFHEGKTDAKLTTGQEIAAGAIGGALASWNHPFEVARIEMQSRAIHGETKLSMMGVLREVWAQKGIIGVFKGYVPRVCLSIWQTLFMVTGAKLVTW